MPGKTETFGSPIARYSIDQLTARADLFSKEGKTPQDLMAINSNTAWVKLRSSVNEISPADQKALFTAKDKRGEIIGEAAKAEQYVLIGGTRQIGAEESNMRKGVSFAPDQIDATKAYNNLNLGFRPMPGITGLKVATKNRMGTVMQAEVDFVVYTAEDLEIIELLFFRPGYTVLLEWGHSVFIDSSGNLKKQGPDNQTVTDSIFFNPKTGEEIDNNIDVYRKRGEGNYEGMFGMITNYNWSYRPDGGYDCSLKLISRGNILESMKVGKTTDSVVKEKTDKEKDKKDNKSIFHYIFSRLEQSKKQTNGNKLLNTRKAKKIGNLLQDFDVFRIKQDLERTGLFSFWEKSIDLTYIKLKTFLDIINNCSVLIDTKNNQKLIYFNTDFGQKFNTYDDHWSTDPIVAVKPKVPTNTKASIERDGLHKAMQTAARDKTDDIMNIMISTHFILGRIDAAIGEKQESQANLLDIIQGVLSGIQEAFGNINEFDLYLDPDYPSTYTVVDRNNARPEGIPTIDVTGLRSTVVDLSITSKISSNISNMVAVAAQGNSGNYSENVSTLLQWNGGAIDRHIPVRDNSDSKTEEEEKERIEKYYEDLEEAWDQFNGLGIFNNQVYDGELWQQLKMQNIAQIQKEYKLACIEKGSIPRGVIPVELSLKMLGISGLKPGTTFKINKGILPPKYNNYGFFINGLTHSISNGKWMTDFKCQFFPLKGAEKDPAAARRQRQAGSSTNSALNQGSTPIINANTDPTPNADRLRAELRNIGYREKGTELSNGGDITSQTADMGIAVAKKIKEEVPNVTLIFTGGNDLYHQKLSYNSRHKRGTGLDMVVSPYSQSNVNAVLKVLQGFAAGNSPNFRFIDEYRRSTQAATAPHFHFSWGPGTEGKYDYDKALALAGQGKIKKYNV